MTWRPGDKLARRIASVLLSAHRHGRIEMKCQEEIVCVDAAMRYRCSPGTRHVLGRLWRQYGGPELLAGPHPQNEELRAALSA